MTADVWWADQDAREDAHRYYLDLDAYERAQAQDHYDDLDYQDEGDRQ